jgi:hypothetical protein
MAAMAAQMQGAGSTPAAAAAAGSAAAGAALPLSEMAALGRMSAEQLTSAMAQAAPGGALRMLHMLPHCNPLQPPPPPHPIMPLLHATHACLACVLFHHAACCQGPLQRTVSRHMPGTTWQAPGRASHMLSSPQPHPHPHHPPCLISDNALLPLRRRPPWHGLHPRDGQHGS